MTKTPNAASKALGQAMELHRAGRLDEAERAYRAVLAANERAFEAMHGLGVLCLQRGMAEQGERQLRLALGLNRESAAAWHDHGLALRALGRHDEAVESFQKCAGLAPDNVQALLSLGRSQMDSGFAHDALATFDRAVALDGSQAASLYHRANALLRAGRARDAVDSFDAAIVLKPDYFEAYLQRGNALRELDRLADAVASYEEAVRLGPNSPPAVYNLAFALHDSGRFDDALANYNRAVGLAPNFHDARKARGTLRLLRGDFERGFADFESRLNQWDNKPPPKISSIRYWSGEDLSGKSIVVYGDGAFGDLVQFSRYLPLLAGRGARVVLLAPPQFHRVLDGERMRARLAADPGEPSDLRCEIMSLPFLFKTRLDTIPPAICPIQRDEARIAAWKERLPRGRLNIGICWQGNPVRHIDRGRSIPLAEFRPLADVPGVRLVSLQKKHGLEQLETRPDGFEIALPGEDLDGGADAFVDTAALMESLDLIVTSDTAVAHLAAALGRPTWIALRRVPEWRWRADGDDSPWYPNVRLFRQRVLGEWTPVFEEIAAALKEIRSA